MCQKVMLISWGCLSVFCHDCIEIWKIASIIYLNLYNIPKLCWSVHYLMQVLQTLTGWSHPLSLTGLRLGEHASHTPWPHARQWCSVSLGPKALPHTLQLFINSSGIQYDGRVVSFRNSGMWCKSISNILFISACHISHVVLISAMIKYMNYMKFCQFYL